MQEKRVFHKLTKNWYFILIGLFFIGAAGLYLICGENAHIEVQDNLDLFQAQYEMLKRQNAFFAQGTAAPFLGGVSRNVLPSELSLTSVLYMIFPSFTAYIVLYFVKIALAIVSFTLLAKEVLPGHGTSDAACNSFDAGERGIVVLSGFAYGLLNMFPAFGISFASIPLFIFLMIRLYRTAPAGLGRRAKAPATDADGKNTTDDAARAASADGPAHAAPRSWRRALPYLSALFVYPFISYFSYFGLFLLAYACVALLWMWIRDRRFPLSIFLGIVFMAIGCVLFEYRLFSQMLFTDAVSIRTTMVQGDLSLSEVAAEILDVYRNGIFHSDGLQRVFILPLCLVWFAGMNLYYIVKGQSRRIFTDLYNLIMLILVFNSVVYGLYDYTPARSLIENLVPQMRGLQLNRTIFFSPFLWYAALCIICLRIYRYGCGRAAAKTGSASGQTVAAEAGHAGTAARSAGAARFLRAAASILPLLAIAVILRNGSRYNDLYSTARAFLYEKVKGVTVDDLSYREFYSTDLFEEIKEDLAMNTGDMKTTDGKPAAEAEESFGELEQEIYSDDANYGVGSRVSSDVIAEEAFEVTDSGIDWAVAYGLHPAVLEYNGIPTLDGYLGFYDESYKDVFRKAIAPALESWEPTAIYYDDWGARCYLYSGSENTIVQATRSYVTDPASSEIMIDEPALKALGCRYIFSRICLTNAAQKNLTLRGTYSSEDSPYTIYVYELN